MQSSHRKDNPAVVLGMYETGLGVARSLGREHIRVIGVDFKRDIGFYSKYIDAYTCPHPIRQTDAFRDFMVNISRKCSCKPALFITADEFVTAVSRLRKILSDLYLFNMPTEDIIECIIDKEKQYKKAEQIAISIPRTFYPHSLDDLDTVKNMIEYPVFVKPCYSHEWRVFFGGIKGFAVNSYDELRQRFALILEKKMRAIVQAIVQGPDTNHFKYCCYISKKGEILLAFTLQKIRQQPIRFGVGACVESTHYPDLCEIGAEFFRKIGYTGVGSAEFKLDQLDGRLKLIELNPRYWQQNALADACGMNFPLIDYLEVTGQNPQRVNSFIDGVKWVNIYMDFDAYLSYRGERELSLRRWLRSLKGKKILSDFAIDDIKPAFYETKFLKRLSRLPRYLMRKLKHG